MLSNRTLPKMLQRVLKLGLVKRFRASLFIQRVSLTLVTRIILLVLGFILSIITARYLGTEGRGIYAVTASIVAMGVQFGNLGLHSANTYFIARDKSLLGKIIANTLWVSIIGGFIIALIALGITYFNPDIVTGVPVFFLVVAVLGIPFSLLYLLGQNIVLGIQRIKVLNAFETAQAVINVVAIVVLLVLLKQGVFSLIVLSTVIAFICGVIIITYVQRIEKSSLAFNLELLKKTSRYGFKAYIAGLLAFLVIRFNILMVNYFLGSGEVGIYSIATSTADILYLLPASIGMILFPQISGMSEGGWAYSKKVAGVTAIIMAAICIVVALIARPFIAFFYGQDFASAADALLWLLPGVFVFSVNTIFMNFFAARGLPLIVVFSPLVALIANVLLNLYFIPHFGIEGAAMVSSISYLIMLVFSLIYLRVREDVRKY
jgi:O-antigen/teichoic acid export membrane protein